MVRGDCLDDNFAAMFRVYADALSGLEVNSELSLNICSAGSVD